MMNGKNGLLLLLLCSGLLGAEIAMAVETYSYIISPVTKSEALRYRRGMSAETVDVEVNEQDKTVTAHQGNISDTKGQENGWMYLPAPILFALPPQAFLHESKWQYQGFSYENVGIEKVGVLGKMLDVHVIRMTIDACKKSCDERVFYYSTTNGLIGFKIVNFDRGYQSMYWSVGEIGVLAR